MLKLPKFLFILFSLLQLSVTAKASESSTLPEASIKNRLRNKAPSKVEKKEKKPNKRKLAPEQGKKLRKKLSDDEVTQKIAERRAATRKDASKYFEGVHMSPELRKKIIDFIVLVRTPIVTRQKGLGLHHKLANIGLLIHGSVVENLK